MPEDYGTPERLIAFSDGVIAVVITIMVIDIKPPEFKLGHPLSIAELYPLAPRFIDYCLSYLIIGRIWIKHCRLLRSVRRATLKIFRLNLLFLFTVSLLPFFTALVAETGFKQSNLLLIYSVICWLVYVTYVLLGWATTDESDKNLGVELSTFQGALPFYKNALWISLIIIILNCVVFFVTSNNHLPFDVIRYIVPVALLLAIIFLPDKFLTTKGS